jgi:hypothetical protein
MTAVDVSYPEQVGRLLDRLRDGLRPFVERELQRRLGDQWPEHVFGQADALGAAIALQDVAVLLKTMDRYWKDAFDARLSRLELAQVIELIEWRNRWAHGETFTQSDVARVEDNVDRLLLAVAGAYAAGVERPAATPAVPPARAARDAVAGEAFYKCLVCGGMSSQPDEPWCAYRLPMYQAQGARCGFQTRRWQKIDAAQAATLRSTHAIQDELRRQEFVRMGGPYALGCLGVLLGILALIWVIGPMFIWLKAALTGH